MTDNFERNLNRSFKKIKNRFFLPNFMSEMNELSIGGLSGGNTVDLIIDGDLCFDEYIKTIENAPG
jgi:hypothetical protein